MYINADPDAITPSGDLLTSSYHAGQHAEHREEHSKYPGAWRTWRLAGYVAFIAQRYGCSPRNGGTRPGTSGSVNIMTAPFELCVRAFDRMVGPPPAAGGPRSEGHRRHHRRGHRRHHLHRSRERRQGQEGAQEPSTRHCRHRRPRLWAHRDVHRPYVPGHLWLVDLLSTTYPARSDPGLLHQRHGLATHSFIVMRTVPGLFNGAERCTLSTQFT
jgi:hypothetical protein